MLAQEETLEVLNSINGEPCDWKKVLRSACVCVCVCEREREREREERERERERKRERE